MTDRLPAAVEVSALLRQVGAAGGFATVIAKGEAESGAILVILCENGSNYRLFERMPTLGGGRVWHCSRQRDPANPAGFSDYLARRQQQDADLWVIELDIVNGERFIGLSHPAD